MSEAFSYLVTGTAVSIVFQLEGNSESQCVAVIDGSHGVFFHSVERLRCSEAHGDALRVLDLDIEVGESRRLAEASEDIQIQGTLRRPIAHGGVVAAEVVGGDLVDVGIVPDGFECLS